MSRCLTCRKSLRTCYCAAVVPVRARTRFAILQHPRERYKAIGTGRMSARILEGARLCTQLDFERDAEVQGLLRDPANRCVILYPGPNAQVIEPDPSAHDSSRSGAVEESLLADRTLWVFVLDGTWACAAKLLALNPSLRRLPQISLRLGPPSEYRIRRQPAEHCLSTLEAIARVLAALEPDVDTAPLLGPFHAMVAQQLRFQHERQNEREIARVAAKSLPPSTAPRYETS